MTDYPPAFQELITALQQLPSVGPRSAERLALFLLQSPPSVSDRIATAIGEGRRKIHPCSRCGFYAEGPLCTICADEKRDHQVLCIVEQSSDVLKLEKSGAFRGYYHVLGGRLSPLDGIGPEQLNITSLQARLETDKPAEVVLALGADVEGETTALYLLPLIKAAGVRVSRLATGLPAGGGLEFADSVTLGYALSGRREL